MAKGQFDTIVLDSVAQYFAHRQQLVRVIEALLELVARGGRLILRDFCHLSMLPLTLPGITATEVRLKRGWSRDETTCRCYEVILHTGTPAIDLATIPDVTWDRRLDPKAACDLLDAERPRALRIRDIANARLCGQADGVEPEAMYLAGESLGYWVALTPSVNNPARMDAVFVDVADPAALIPLHL